MSVRRWLVGLLVPLGVVAVPEMAAAEISAGECTGSVQFVNGTQDGGPFTLDADHPLDDVVVVPRSDTVQWSGSSPATSGTYAGSVSVDLPFPLGAVEIEQWSGTIVTNTNAGTDTYDLPSVIPGGVEFVVSATHTDTAGTCAGSVRVKIEGGAFGSALTPVALVVTLVLAGAALAIAGVFGGGASAAGGAAATGGRP